MSLLFPNIQINLLLLPLLLRSYYRTLRLLDIITLLIIIKISVFPTTIISIFPIVIVCGCVHGGCIQTYEREASSPLYMIVTTAATDLRRIFLVLF